MSTTNYSARPRSLVVALTLALVAVTSCRRTASKPATPAGQERGPCRSDRTCDPGLTCLSELCVRPPAADCAKVGEHVAYLLLDNYAPREERDAVRTDVTRQCQELGLSAADGACVLAVKSRGELRSCPRVVGLGDCPRIVAHLDSIRSKSGVDAYLVTGADRLIARCRNEAPTLAFERCVLAARTIDDVDRCVW
jgi:hypothetical protein